jgi:hypothetical protein
MRSLQQIGTSFGEDSDPNSQGNLMAPAEFWQKYDAGQIK